MVEQTVSAFGRLDAAFNNAGVQSLAVETADATSEEFDRVNAVNPGLIDTQIGHDVFKGDEQVYDQAAKSVPIGRAGRPEEIAAAVLWLCSPGAGFVIGHALAVDGGYTAH